MESENRQSNQDRLLGGGDRKWQRRGFGKVPRWQSSSLRKKKARAGSGSGVLALKPLYNLTPLWSGYNL